MMLNVVILGMRIVETNSHATAAAECEGWNECPRFLIMYYFFHLMRCENGHNLTNHCNFRDQHFLFSNCFQFAFAIWSIRTNPIFACVVTFIDLDYSIQLFRSLSLY